ncbi:hypothetical protein OF83DRAFT_1166216 [Amylostereum chailletii]|nr:hypothetical protein OF83DRAFT_1166216 [Amylostereum chailletii]
MSSSSSAIPFVYRLFFLYIEPLLALAGAYYAAIQPSSYLHELLPFAPSYHTPPPGVAGPPATPTLMALHQLANLYLLFALNEHFVLASTDALRTWKTLLAGLLVADAGHLVSMVPAGRRAFEVWAVGFVYLGAGMRVCFLMGVGLGETKVEREKGG